MRIIALWAGMRAVVGYRQLTRVSVRIGQFRVERVLDLTVRDRDFIQSQVNLIRQKQAIYSAHDCESVCGSVSW